MHGCRINTDNICRLSQLLCSLGLSLSMDDLGPSLPLCLSLTGNGPLHVCIKVHLFCLHQGYLDPPRLCMLVQDVLELEVNLVSFRQEFVQLGLAYDAPQCRLGQLGSGVKVIFNSDHGLIGIYDTKVDDRIDLDGDVVTGNHILRWNLQCHGPQADPEQLVHTWDDEDKPWSLCPDQSSHTEDDAPLIFPYDLY